jgi:nucleotide sugar dehydrogenase
MRPSEAAADDDHEREDRGISQDGAMLREPEPWILERRAIRVGVVGLGRVGRATGGLFRRFGYEVTGWDRDGGDAYPGEGLARCDFGVVCVGTPARADGAADVSAVEEAVERLPVPRVLLRSTVPPGTTDALVERSGKRICFWPEYVSESSYHNPYFPERVEDVPFVILGGEPGDRQWFVDRLIEVLGPTKRYFQCTAREAEVVKYAENAYFATKITFANELRRVCDAVGADWHTVREGWLLDPRVEPMHTAAFATEPGFSGRCLPKDLDAIVAASRAAGYDPSLLAEVAETNRRLREPHAQPASRPA